MMPHLLALVVVSSYIILFVYTTYVDETAGELTITKNVMTTLSIAVGMVVQYYFGSSHKEDKDK